MSTVAEIISFAEATYPRAIDINEATKLVFLNQILDEVYNKLQRVNHTYAFTSTTTVADQANYSLPNDCDADNIVKIQVSRDTTVDENTTWDEFHHVGLLDDFDLSAGQYYSTQSSNLYLFDYGSPIATTGLTVKIFYYPTPSPLTATTDIPEVNTKYHNLFKYGLIQMIACIGDNPETEIADYWQRKYDEELSTAIKNMSSKFASAPLQQRQAVEYW